MEDALFRSPYYRVSVKALVIDDKWKILLIQGEEGMRDLPWWGLDRWESPVAWLKREITEETWLSVQYIDSNPSYFLTRKEEGKRRSNTIYKTKVTGLDFRPSKECVHLEFFTVEEAQNLSLFPNMPIFLEQYKDNSNI
jgi:hypothetical protein